MKSALQSFALLALAFGPAARGDTILYDNTNPADDTGDTVLYSIGPYIALGDQIQLASAGTADQAEVEFYNNGGAGTFDAELDFFAVGSPVGAPLGSFDYPTEIASVGGDVIDLTFDLSGLTVPQNVIFTVSVSNLDPVDPSVPMDLGLDMFEPPGPGTSDPTFMIAATSGPTYIQLGTNDEDVYFQLSGTPSVSAVPEASNLTMMALGLLVVWIVRKHLYHRL